MWTIFYLIGISLVLGIGGWLFFMWAVKSGQLENMEDAKYRMLEDDEDEDK